MLSLAQIGRGRRQQVLIGAALILGVVGLALILAGRRP